MSVVACSSYCKLRGYSYFGLQAETWCLCGNSYGKYGEGRALKLRFGRPEVNRNKKGGERPFQSLFQAQNCNLTCRGNVEDTCGGHWANSLYKITQLEQNEIFSASACEADEYKTGSEWLNCSDGVIQVQSSLYGTPEYAPNGPCQNHAAGRCEAHFDLSEEAKAMCDGHKSQGSKWYKRLPVQIGIPNCTKLISNPDKSCLFRGKYTMKGDPCPEIQKDTVTKYICGGKWTLGGIQWHYHF